MLGVPLVQHLLDVRVQPVALELVAGHVLGARDPALADALAGAAVAVEGLGHVPLGARVEEGQGVADA